jgi:hypothetical protein
MKARQAETIAEQQIFNKWRKAETLEEREELVAQARALKSLTNNIIHSIRGEKHG